jgi:hypothetical protein
MGLAGGPHEAIVASTGWQAIYKHLLDGLVRVRRCSSRALKAGVFFKFRFHLEQSHKVMGGGPAVSAGGGDYARLIDPSRKWYNNRRYVLDAFALHGHDILIRV